MRIQELRHLTWNDVNFDLKILTIQAKGSWKPKSGDSRSFKMLSRVSEIIQRQPKVSDWIFTFPAKGKFNVRQVNENRLLDYLKRKLEKLKLFGKLHTFRHSFISMALVAGTPEALVRNWVGHVDAKILARYTHIASQYSNSAMDQLEKNLEVHFTNSNA